MKRTLFALTSIGLMFLFPLVAVSDDHDGAPILPQLANSPLQVVPTVPANGDQNPYGVAFVPHDFARGGKIHPGDILVSNFNNASNTQGTGTTIVSIDRQGNQTLFFGGKSGLGLTTALGVLRRGVVLVGNVPTNSSGIAQQGSLIAIDRHGKEITSFTDDVKLDGPWDLTLLDFGERAIVFVSNVLNGTVSRLELRISDDGERVRLEHSTLVAKGYLFRTDPLALVVGPTGLVFDRDEEELFVASTGDNAIYKVRNALKRDRPAHLGVVVYEDNAHLRGPLGLIRTPNGDFITTNGDAVNPDPAHPSEMIEFTKSGKFVAQFSVDTSAEGGAFGIAIHGQDDHLRLAAVDDINNTLEIWTIDN
ncbi:MAG: hypothetical protein JOY54_18725 [Acidobacteriaceae bacterium]|nr:hypothetical protein [Acidobacteriaceae bacterium]